TWVSASLFGLGAAQAKFGVQPEVAATPDSIPVPTVFRNVRRVARDSFTALDWRLRFDIDLSFGWIPSRGVRCGERHNVRTGGYCHPPGTSCRVGNGLIAAKSSHLLFEQMPTQPFGRIAGLRGIGAPLCSCGRFERFQGRREGGGKTFRRDEVVQGIDSRRHL